MHVTFSLLLPPLSCRTPVRGIHALLDTDAWRLVLGLGYVCATTTEIQPKRGVLMAIGMQIDGGTVTLQPGMRPGATDHALRDADIPGGAPPRPARG